MGLVVDASVAACWLLPDESHPVASAVRRRIQQEAARNPAIWWFEIRNVIVMAERRGRLSSEQAMAAFGLVDTLPIRTEPLPEAAAVISLARRHRLTFYDAAYLELAQRERLPLATLDGALRTAASAEGIALVAA